MKKFILILLLLNCLYAENPLKMTPCNPDSNDVEVMFLVPTLIALKKIGFKLIENDTIKDTGSSIFYIQKLDVYYLTKRDGESFRYDGEIFKYLGHNCILKEVKNDSL